MPIVLELPPEVEASLAAQARARGLWLDAYLASMLKAQAATRLPERAMPPQEIESRLDALAQGSEDLPYLPPEALTRQSFYQDRLMAGTPYLADTNILLRLVKSG